MTDNFDLNKYLAAISGQDGVLVIQRWLLQIVGNDFPTALLANQLIYWSTRLPEQNEGWLHKSAADWEKEIAISTYQLGRATSKLKELGFPLETRKAKSPYYNFAPVTQYKLDPEAIAGFVKIHFVVSSKWEVKKLTNLNNIEYATENTKEKDSQPLVGGVQPITEMGQGDTQCAHVFSDGECIDCGQVEPPRVIQDDEGHFIAGPVKIYTPTPRQPVSLTDLENPCPECNHTIHDGRCLCETEREIAEHVMFPNRDFAPFQDKNLPGATVTPLIPDDTLPKDNRADLPNGPEYQNGETKPGPMQSNQKAVEESEPEAKKPTSKKKPKYTKEQRDAMKAAILDSVGCLEKDVKSWSHINKLATQLLDDNRSIELIAEWRDWNKAQEVGRAYDPGALMGKSWTRFMTQKREQATPTHKSTPELDIQVEEEFR